jgi:nicotinamide-nucleotide amidase
MSLASEIASLVEDALAVLREKGETLSTAESLTAGSLSSAITSIPGSSDVFLGGITAYQSSIKSSHLGVSEELITKHTVFSEEVAIAMAQGALKSFGSTWAISTTGVAGPGPSDGVAAGTVWVAIEGPVTQAIELSLSGERDSVRNATTASAMAAFARILRARK